MRRRWVVSALLGGLLLARPAVGGGEPRIAVTLPEGSESATRHPVAVVEGRLEGASGVRVVVRSPRGDLDLVAPLGRTTAVVAAPPGADARAWAERVRERARADGIDEAAPPRAGRPLVRLVAAAPREDGLAGLLARLSLGPRRIEFRIEVLPRATYLARYPRDGEVPPRLASESPADWPWPGTAEEFDAYQIEEIRRWKAARAAGRPYEPSRPGFRVVPTDAAVGPLEFPPDQRGFHVLEEPPASEAFDGRMLEDPVPGEDPSLGSPVVLFGVRREFQQALGAWTERNRGLPMAIVLDGTWRTAPVIQDRLEDRVQVTLGRGGVRAPHDEARALASVLQQGEDAGAHARALVLVRVSLDGDVQVAVPLDTGGRATVALAPAGAARAGAEVVRSVVRDEKAEDPLPLRVAALGALHAIGLAEAEGALRRDLREDEAGRAALGESARRGRRPLDRLLALRALAVGEEAGAWWGLALADRDLGVRLAAAEQLLPSAEADARVLPLLLEVAARGTQALQARARDGLRDRAGRARGEWSAALDRGDARVRAAAADALAAAEDDEGLRLLARALRDEDRAVRSAAAWGLVAHAARGLASSPPARATAAQEDLLAALAALVRSDPDAGPVAARALGARGEAGARALRELLRSEDGGVRAAALQGLAGIPGDDADRLALLRAALGDGDARVRLAAAWRLSERGAERDAARRAALAVAHDPQERDDLRLHAVLLVATRSEDAASAEAALRPLLSDPDPLVRGAAVLALDAVAPRRGTSAAEAEGVRRAAGRDLQEFEKALLALLPDSGRRDGDR